MKLAGALVMTTVVGAAAVTAILWLSGAFEASQKRAEELKPAQATTLETQPPEPVRRFVPLLPKPLDAAPSAVSVDATPLPLTEAAAAPDAPDASPANQPWLGLEELLLREVPEAQLVTLRVQGGDGGIRAGRPLRLVAALKAEDGKARVVNLTLLADGSLSDPYLLPSDGPVIGEVLGVGPAPLRDLFPKIAAFHRGATITSLQVKRFSHLTRPTPEGSFASVRIDNPASLWEVCLENANGGVEYWYYDCSTLEPFAVPQD